MKETTQGTAVTSTKGINWWLRLVAMWVLIISVLTALAIYLIFYNSAKPEPQAASLPELSGGIFLSLLLDQTELSGTVNYAPIIVAPGNDPNNQALYIPIEQSDTPIFSLQLALSADAQKMTFLGWPLVESLSHQTPAIYRTDIGGTEGNYDVFIQKIRDTANLVSEPDTEDYFRQGPAISDSGNILYASLGEAEFDPEPAMYGSVLADEWTIYMLDSTNEPRTLTSGLAPKWIAEDRFVFLKNDGIYVYDLGANNESLIWRLDFMPKLVNAFDVSDDGSLIAIANHETETITILDWDKSGSATISSEIPAITVSGLTFSPNNSYLAMLQLVSFDESGEEGYARLIYYAMAEQKFHDKYVDLNELKPLGLYMTDWK